MRVSRTFKAKNKNRKHGKSIKYITDTICTGALSLISMVYNTKSVFRKEFISSHKKTEIRKYFASMTDSNTTYNESGSRYSVHIE